MTDEHFDHNNLQLEVLKKGDVKNNYWPVDTSFHVNFVGDAFE